MTPVTTQTQPISFARATAAFQRIMPRGLDKLLAETTLTDTLTLKVKELQTEVNELLLQIGPDEEPLYEHVATRFRQILKRILVDAVTKAPLDEKAYLGSDGRTYAGVTLMVHSCHAPGKFRHRSPLFPENPDLFTAKEHPIAVYLVNWLKGKDPEYATEISVSKRMIKTIYAEKFRFDGLVAQSAELEAAKKRVEEADDAAALEHEKVYLKAALDPIDKDMQAAHDRIREINAAAGSAAAAEAAGANKHLDELEKEVADLLERLKQLNVRQKTTETEIATVGGRMDAIEKKLQEIEEQIEDKDDTVMQVIKVVAIIGACYFAGWGLKLLLPKLGIGAAAAPSVATTSGGGVSFGWTIPI